MGPYTGGGNAGDPLIADTPTMALDDDETFHTFIDPSAFDEETEAFDSNVFHSLDPMDTGEYKHFTNEGLDNNLFGMAHDSPSGSFLDTSSESSRQQFESSNASPLTDTHMGDMELLNDSKSPEYTSASSYSNMDGSMDQAPDFSVSPEADPSGRIGAAKQEPRSTAPVPKKPAKAKRTRAPPRARAPAQRKQKKRASITDAQAMDTSRQVSPTSTTHIEGEHQLQQYPGQVLCGLPNAGNALQAAWQQFRFGAQPVPPQPVTANTMALRYPDKPPASYIAPYPSHLWVTTLDNKTKSRVETQFGIKIHIWPLPDHIKKLHLPEHTIPKKKNTCRGHQRSPDIAELYVSVYCTSVLKDETLRKRALQRAASHPQDFLPPLVNLKDHDVANHPQKGGELRICETCVARELKRTGRKKFWSAEDDAHWEKHADRRSVVLNTTEMKEWVASNDWGSADEATGHNKPSIASQGSAPFAPGMAGPQQPSPFAVEMPMRIACYCRHQYEKEGFTAILTIKDYRDTIIAQTMMPSIMVTDDHKTQAPSAPPTVGSSSPRLSPAQMPDGPFHPLNPGPQPPALQPAAPTMQMPMRQPQPQLPPSTLAPQTQVPPGPPGQITQGEAPVNAPRGKKRRSSGSRHVGLSMTPLKTSPTMSRGTHNPLLNTTPPFTPQDAFGNMDMRMNPNQPFAAPSPGALDFGSQFNHPNRSPSMDLTMDSSYMPYMHSAPASNHPSRAPSPSSLRTNGMAAPSAQVNHALLNNLFQTQAGVNQMMPPVVHKIIPNEGPTSGGVEVTILGAAFFQGLEVWFGDRRATTTTFWGESSLVCLLPPSAFAGTVSVTLKQALGGVSQAMPLTSHPPVFSYIDENETTLMRTALAVLGTKMNGNFMGIADFARNIINGGGLGNLGGDNSMPGAGGPGGNHQGHLESQILGCLEMIDMDDSGHEKKLDLTVSASEQTMLHMACSLGYHRLVAALVARGADVNARDRGGYTPLHMAAICDQPDIVKRLMLACADSTMRNLSGQTAADVAQSRDIVRAVRHFEGSGRRLHSRANSAASLRSQWVSSGPSEGRMSSLAHSTDSLYDESSSESDNDNLYMRRPSVHKPQDLQSGIEKPLPSPNGTALMDHFQQQFHHFQQSMGQHFQGFAQLPRNMPQMPTLGNLKMMQDYQAYLQEHPLMQRVQQFMPSMTHRPGSQDGPTKMDHRWWDLASYMNNASTPPPAYEEIYPNQDDQDTKIASAALAAADAEADLKCTTRYDQQTTTEERTQSPGPLPSVLKIGRKNAITQEQRENFLRVHAQNLKGLTDDSNLFLIWIPLLLIMLCMTTYHLFPSILDFVVPIICRVLSLAKSGITQIEHNLPERWRAVIPA